MPLLNDDEPTLVSFAKKDVFATVRLLESLKKESVHCASLLHYLSWEADNTGYLYDRVNISSFVKELIENKIEFSKEIRNRRFSSSFINEYNGYKARIRAAVLFKHAVYNVETYSGKN